MDPEKKSISWMDSDEKEPLWFKNWANETQTYFDKVSQQLINLDKSRYIIDEIIDRRNVIMGKDGKWIAVDDSFTKNSEAERYVVCESTDKYQRLIVNG